MEQLDIIILTSILSIAFIAFIIATLREFRLMDDNNRYDVVAEGNGVERQTIECFKVGDTYYSVEKVLDEPHRNWYVANELIIEIKSKNELV